MKNFLTLSIIAFFMILDLLEVDKLPIKTVQTKTFDFSEEIVEVEIEEFSEEFILEPIKKKNKVHFTNLNQYRKTIKITATTKQIENYIVRFLPTALVENSKYKIPASIKLAQGILESNAGKSELARAANNHFGIKSFNGKGYKMCDDSCKDRFRYFVSAWASWRYHSTLLSTNSRYKPLFLESFHENSFYKYKDLKGRNYKGKKYSYGKDHRFEQKLKLLKKFWHIPYKRFAYGLDILGYATDNRYAESLIQIIEENNLQDYDLVEIIF